MNIVVQKFGGTSVADPETRQLCMDHIKNELRKDYKVVVVVSAMGRKGEPYATDTLISLLGDEPKIKSRQFDFLLSSGEMISSSVFSDLLEKEGISNIVLNGGQAGIITDEQFGDAKIIDLQPDRLKQELEEHSVVIVPGFQGVTRKGDITTLGRGGSDTSATALGVALQADFVDIFTDVEGVMTADPRIVKEAVPLQNMTYTELCNFAYLGAKVIHPRAVEMAMKRNIPLRIRSTFRSEDGTLVTHNTTAEVNERLITGITQTSDISQFTINIDDHNLSTYEVLEDIKQRNISIDFINLSNGSITFTVQNKDILSTSQSLDQFDLTYSMNRDCSKISIVGASIQGVPGVMSSVVKTLSQSNIPILQSSDSHTTIWVLIPEGDMQEAVRSLHKSFDLAK